MKQAKRKKSSVAPEQGDVAPVAAETLLPDAEYVEQLLAATEPVATESLIDTVVNETAVTEVAAAGAEQSSLCLPDQCLLRDAVEFRQTLMNCLSVQKVAVDIGAVERIDAAFMQVLVAFVRSRPSDLEAVQWTNVNSVFTEAAQLLGLHDALALPAAA